MCQRCFQAKYQDDATNTVFDTRYNPPQSLREQFADVVNDVLILLLRYGLEPNHVSTKLTQHFTGGTGNGLIGMSVQMFIGGL